VNRSPFRILISLLAVLALTVFAGACGDDDDGASTGAATTGGAATAPADTGDIPAAEKDANKIAPIEGAQNVSLTVGSKNFTEQYVLGEIYSQALEAAGYTVKTDLKLGDALIAYKALVEGEIDAYPEYTGTSLTSFFDVKVEDVPKDAQQAYDDTKAAYAKKNITALAPTPFENTYRMAVTKETASKIGNPTKISDLAEEAKDLTVNGYPECRQRVDCLLGVQETYGLKFKRFVASDSPYPTLDNGDADIAFVFTTDGALASDKYVVLDDDKSLFPPYNISFTVRNDAAEKLGEEGQAVITNVQKYMTEEIMQELNARVDVDKDEPASVAAEYLTNFGFTS
jgi:glycine betaine/choline ABC-type transport system substrate-binding protein